MEPDDLSLLEISGEDDSLLPLQQVPSDGVSSLNKTYFTCSPLQIPRSACPVNLPPSLISPIGGITGNKDAGKLNLSSNRDSVDKENINSNKPEVPKLSMEPQQMKRKKKEGGYNLRKSLAWDRAFFTEEGVLDPLELSMISGNFGKSSGEMLSAIEEDERESLGGNLEDLTALEENMFKELPESNVSEDRKSSGAFLPKGASPAGDNVASTSAAKHKVFSTRDANRSGSKRSGCPRPVASSSLKRPANANSMKSTTKELKVSKTLIRKLDSNVHSTTAKSNIIGASNMKRNQIAQPAVSVQRNVGFGSSNSKSARSGERSGLAGRSIAVKSSVHQARRNLAKAALDIQPSARSQHPLVRETNNALKIDSGTLLTTPGHVSSNRDGNSCKAALSLSSGGSMQFAQPQTAKPSGLRMPSPSLGFFNQSKASASHNLLLRSNQACSILESSSSNFRKGALNAIHERPIPAPQKKPDMGNGATASDMRVPRSIEGSSISTSHNTNSHEKIQSNLCKHELQKVELNVSSNSNSFGILNNQQKLQSLCNGVHQPSLQNVGPSKNEKISHVVDNESKNTDNVLLLHEGLTDQLKNEDNKRVANIYPVSMDLSGTELENFHFSSRLQSTAQVKGVFETKDMIDYECVEEKTCNLLTKNHAASSESQFGDAISNSVECTVKRKEDWLSPVHNVNEQSRKQAEDMIPSTNQVSTEAQKPRITNGALSEEGRSSEFQNKSAKVADATPVGCCSGSVVESSYGQAHSDDTVEAKDCVAGVDNFCTKSQVRDTEVQSVDSILSARSIEVVLCSSALDKMVVDDVTEYVIDANGGETAKCPHGDGTISGFTDAKFSHDIDFHGQTTYGESEMIGKDQNINVVKTTIVEVCSAPSNNGGFSGCELDLQHFEIQPSVLEKTKNDAEINGMIAAFQVKNGYVIDDVNEHGGIENKQYSLSANNHCSNSDLRPADDIGYCQQSSSKVHNDWLSNIPIVCQQSVEGNQVVRESDECLSEGSIAHEDSEESNAGKVAYVIFDVKGCCQRGSESPQDLFRHELVEQGNEEVAGFDNTIEKSVKEESQMQFLEGSLLVDGSNCNFNVAIVDDVLEQSLVRPELNSDLADALGSLDGHGLSLNDKLIVNNGSAVEYQDKNLCSSLMGAVIGQSDACGNKSTSSVVCTQVAAEVREGVIDENQKAYCPSEDDNEQNIEVNVLKSDVLSEEACISLNNGSSNLQMKHELENLIFSTEDATMSSLGGVFQDKKVNVLQGYVSPADAETSISQKNDGSKCEMQLELEDAICPTEDEDATKFRKKSGIDKQQDNLVIKPPPHAVPFSDEWLAAFEAAGEEILAKKSGAVQNSPPDKSLPEPGPWSPVKRKNNQGIGPYDCTKFTNGNASIPPSNSS